MRAPTLILLSTLMLAGPSPALAQLAPSGAGASNAANQSFQQQNQMRGMQQQQNFNANQNRLQSSTNQMNSAPRATGPAVAPRRRVNRPERER